MAVLSRGLENTRETNGHAEILWDVVDTNITEGLDEAEKGIKELRRTSPCSLAERGVPRGPVGYDAERY